MQASPSAQVDAVSEHVHGPYLAGTTQHFLNFLVVEAVQGHQWKSLIESFPATQHDTSWVRIGDPLASSGYLHAVNMISTWGGTVRPFVDP